MRSRLRSREALPNERISILRALAACLARGVDVRIWDESHVRPMPDADRLRLTVEADRDEFYRSLAHC